MRLTKIKLAGFKSFVDPTQVTFPSNLTGVVGPNGCGKSNVIDAAGCEGMGIYSTLPRFAAAAIQKRTEDQARCG